MYPGVLLYELSETCGHPKWFEVSAPVHLELWTGFGCVGLGPRGFGDRASLDNDLLDCPKIESFEEK